MSNYETRLERNRALITVECEPSLKQRCEQIAKIRDETLSQVVRKALRDYVEQNAQMELPRPRKVKR
jgi:predicted transcriptional regulator